jgi:hypothetical protein
MLTAVGSCGLSIGFISFSAQELLRYTAIYDIPRKNFVKTEGSVGIERRINTRTFKN